MKWLIFVISLIAGIMLGAFGITVWFLKKLDKK